MSDAPATVLAVGFLSRGRELQASADQWTSRLTLPLPPQPPAGSVTTWDDLTGLDGVWGLDSALLVPAFARGLNVITGVLAGLPLVDMDPATGQRLAPQGLTAQPTMSPGITNTTLMKITGISLVCWGKAFWQVTAVDGFNWPTAVVPIPNERVSASDGAWLVDGVKVPTTGVGRLIAFETGAPGALDHGWQTLATALALETAARNYADSPTPSVVLQSVGLDLDEDEADELLGKWAFARRRKSTAYLNSQVEAKPIGFSATELQLVEARQHMAIEVARVLNLDSYWVGAQAAGSSVTYNNEQDRRAGLLDFTIVPLGRVIEQRLSMADVTGGKRVIRFSTLGFLRANLGERVAALTAYVAAGIMTIDEARAIEPLVQAGDIPA